MITKINTFFQKNWPFFLILLVSFGLFGFFQFNNRMPLFSGEDSYYHVGMANYIFNHGIPKEFPYLNFTILNKNFVDQELLFHLLLIPFIKIFGNVLGAKLMIILFCSLSFAFVYLIFKEKKLKYAIIVPLIMLFAMPSDFYFRLNFIRVQSVSLFFMILTFYLLLKNRYFMVGVISFLFSWLYGGTPFVPMLVFAYLAAQFMCERKIDYKMAIFTIAGFGLGTILNPFFPRNIYFLYTQTFLTGLNAKAYSGGEWQPYDTWYWVQISAITLIVFSIGIFTGLAKTTKRDFQIIGLLIFTFFITILQLKSKRFVEYWPFLAALSGFLLLAKPAEVYLKKIKFQWGSAKHWLYVLIILILAQQVYLKCNEQISKASNDTATPISQSSIESVQNFLIQNSQNGNIVFTDDWDVFPYYFYYNQKDYYIVGLDPEFMNQYNSALYKEFAAISSGSDSSNLERIKHDFSASWVLVGNDHQQFKNNLEAKPALFQKVFDNGNYYLFKVL